MTIPADLSALSDAELRKLENTIARKHSGMVPWGIVARAFGNLVVWLALWPLVILDVVPLWLGFVVATLNMTLVYLPTHDAQHYIIGKPRSKLFWLNQLVGHATSWMMVYPYEVLRVTHMDHHRHTNDPELDVDITSHADNAWQAIWHSIRQRQPDGKRAGDYLRCLERNGPAELIPLAIGYKLGFVSILISLAWSGFALEAFFLWWLPYQIAITYLLFFLSWHRTARAWGRGATGIQRTGARSGKYTQHGHAISCRAPPASLYSAYAYARRLSRAQANT